MTECELIAELKLLRDRLSRAEVQMARKKVCNGAGGWWEISGFRVILDDSIKRVQKHAARASRVSKQGI